MANDPVILRVAAPVPVATTFDYLWTGAGEAPAPGCRVRVPFGKTERVGVVMAIDSRSDVAANRLRSVSEALDAAPIINRELLATLAWCAEYYHFPVGEVVSQALPMSLRRGRALPGGAVPGWRLTDAGRAGDVDTLVARAPRQAEVLAALADAGELPVSELRTRGISRDALARLAVRKLIEAVEIEPGPPAPDPGSEPGPERGTGGAAPPQLMDDQRRAVEAVLEHGGAFQPFLLQGVTGSGKTEVYLRLIQSWLKAGLQSLLLVPEIGLTPQLVARLEERFGKTLAIMHSSRTDSERLSAWHDAFTGEAKVIVGTRSAVFAPLPAPGLIIVDEEHDASYKQHEGFRYSARDLAVYRARQLDVPVLLASATPSLESIHNARRGRYELLTMPRRIGSAGEPAFHIVDLNRHTSTRGISTPLVAAIERHLADGNQVLLFLNRRGFAPVLFCAECRTLEECTFCDSRMTVHASTGSLRCHHCGSRKPLSWVCASCGAERIAVGEGTQRVTDELTRLFPSAAIGRLDRDVAARHGVLEQVLADVEAGQTQILVGTQMLTKGHDFPRVTMVGVLNADQGLLGADFRSNERLAQTLLQVAGRAGRRDHPGEVFIQTHYPSHPLLQCLTETDYTSFADLALDERREAGWPPFSHLVVWRAEAATRAPAHAFLKRVADHARRIAGDITILGPAAPSMERRSGRYRAQLLFQGASRGALHSVVGALLAEARSWPRDKHVRFSIDVDPAEL
ncbi:MAG TPA: primosomal protein N' [Gammaproteobacteria bacterium]